MLDEIYRLTKPGGSFFYNHKIRWVRGEMLHPLDWLRRTKWTVRQELIWDRMLAGNIRGWRFWQVEERTYWLLKPANGNLIGQELRSCDAKLTSIWRGVPDGKNPHPGPVPAVVARPRDSGDRTAGRWGSAGPVCGERHYRGGLRTC